MDGTYATSLLSAVTEAGLAGAEEPELLRMFCERLNAERVPVARAIVMIDTLHPVHEGHVFRWRRDETEVKPVTEYGRISEGGDAAEKWSRSTSSTCSTPAARCCGAASDPTSRRLSYSRRSAREGQTDYRADPPVRGEASLARWTASTPPWATDAPGGFTPAQLSALRPLAPSLALAMKCASLARIAETLVETYLGRDAGRRVLEGRIVRGVAERIGAVLWYSDLRGFTQITETAAPERDHSVPQRLFRCDHLLRARGRRRRPEADRRRHARDLRGRRPGRGLPLRAAAEALMRARIAALNRERAGPGAAGDRSLSRPPHRRGLLRQHRQPGPARLHGRRPGRQRGEPHRRPVPFGRRNVLISSAFAAAAARRTGAPRLGRTLCAERRRARAGAVHAGARDAVMRALQLNRH